MPSTYSTNLKIELQATGENSGTWGTITNTNLGTALEQAIVGYGNPNYASDANLTLTYTDTNAAQAARALVLNVTSGVSLTGTRELVVPTIQKQYIVQNNTTGSQSITVKTSAGTGITVPNGRKAHLYVDGTNVIYMDDYVDINGGSIDGTTIGANSAAAGNFTTVDTTNIEVTNIKAKDGTAAATIADSTGVVSLSANPVLSGGTANGVLYLNGSKVATSGSALTFDGTNLGLTGRFNITAATNQRYSDFNTTSAGYGFSSYSYNGTAFGYVSQASAAFGGGSNTDFAISAVNNLVFGASNAEQARLTSTGLGIGTSSPVARLQVKTQTNANAAFQNSTSVAGGVKINCFNDAGSASSPFELDGSTLQFNIASVERMRLDSSGNLGLGVTPSAWFSTFRAFQFGANGSSVFGRSENNTAAIASNAFVNSSGNFTYINTNTASYYQQLNGQHQFYTAPSGTAGNTISFTQALTLDANVNLLLNGTTAPASGVGTFAIFNGTAPTGSVTNGCVLYTEDVSSSSELKVRDEAGNVTTLSPHNFSLIPEGASEDMAWAYYSEKGGKRINVDMLKLARMVEKLTGEKLVYEA